jgi:hypothetical protein
MDSLVELFCYDDDFHLIFLPGNFGWVNRPMIGDHTSLDFSIAGRRKKVYIERIVPTPLRK